MLHSGLLMALLNRFFALEGLDGAGTTTQCAMLRDAFESSGIDAFLTAEPTNGPAGKLVRSVLKSEVSVTPHTLAYLFAADRHEHLYAPTTGILDRLDVGETVVTDRYLFSSLAYQSVECGFDFVHSLNDGFPLPEAVFFLEVSTDTAIERSSSRGDEEIFENRPFQAQVLENYETVFHWAESMGVAVHRLDGADSAAAIHRNVWNIVSSHPIP